MMDSVFVLVICNTSPWWWLNKRGRFRQGSHKVNCKAQTQLAIPWGTIPLVNRASFILAQLGTKGVHIRLPDSFTQGYRNGVPEHRAHVSVSLWHSDYIRHFKQTRALTEKEQIPSLSARKLWILNDLWL